jgi:hypothetical protein
MPWKSNLPRTNKVGGLQVSNYCQLREMRFGACEMLSSEDAWPVPNVFQCEQFAKIRLNI